MCDKQSVVNQIIRMTSLRRFSVLCVCCTHVCAWWMKLHTQECCGCKWEPEVNFKCFLQLLPDSFRSQDISLHLGDGQVEWSAGSRIPLSLSSQHWAYKCVLLHLIFFFFYVGVRDTKPGCHGCHLTNEVTFQPHLYAFEGICDTLVKVTWSLA